jgi:aquaporin Z
MPRHLPEYVAEFAGLGLFMVVACACSSLIDHPASPLHRTLGEPLARRALMGAAMGTTAMALIYSPLGARSGGHFNPATTLTFWRLGKMRTRDAVAYVVMQLLGAVAGVVIAAALLAPWVAHPAVRYVATVPGPWGSVAALVAELAITFTLMTVVLRVSNHPRWSRCTGVAAGALVALYITVEAPVSGMSLNPARSLAPALWAGTLDTFWIYLLAPVAGMLLAAEVHVRLAGARVHCAKLHHHTTARCIFRCEFDHLRAAAGPAREHSWRRASPLRSASGQP